VASFGLLAVVLKTMPVGIVYAIWSAVGVALVAVLGKVLFDDPVPPLAMVGMVLLLAARCRPGRRRQALGVRASGGGAARARSRAGGEQADSRSSARPQAPAPPSPAIYWIAGAAASRSLRERGAATGSAPAGIGCALRAAPHLLAAG